MLISGQRAVRWVMSNCSATQLCLWWICKYSYVCVRVSMLLFVFPECVRERQKVNADLRGNRPRVCTFAQVQLAVFRGRCWGRLLHEQVDLTSTSHTHTYTRYPPLTPRPRSTHHHSGDANRCAAPHWACLRQAERRAPPQGLWEIWFMMPVVLLTTNFNSYPTVYSLFAFLPPSLFFFFLFVPPVSPLP